DTPATLSDCAVVDTPGWGVVNHSSNVDVEGNVVFNAVGAAYVTEAGDEIGTFNANIAIHSLGSGAGIESRQEVQDFGHQGNGFLRKFQGNVAFASGDGLETWFTLLDVSGKNPDQRNLIENFTTFGNASGRGIFTPYTNLTTIKNSTVTGNLNSPGGTAIAR